MFLPENIPRNFIIIIISWQVDNGLTFKTFKKTEEGESW